MFTGFLLRVNVTIVCNTVSRIPMPVNCRGPSPRSSPECYGFGRRRDGWGGLQCLTERRVCSSGGSSIRVEGWALLGGSWDLVNRVIDTATVLIITYSQVKVLITLFKFTKSHDPPSGVRASVKPESVRQEMWLR